MSLPVEPMGLLSLPFMAARDIIASSAAFQEWIGSAGNKEAALARVHIISAPTDAPTPWALLTLGTFVRDRVTLKDGEPFTQRSGSVVTAFFRDDVADDAVEPTAAILFCNAIGAVWNDVERKAGIHKQSRLAINSMEMTADPARIPKEQRGQVGDYYECAIELTYSRQP